MTFTIEAVYENGILRLSKPLPLTEHEKVTVIVHSGKTSVGQTGGIIPCTDPNLIECAAMDPELDFPPSAEDRRTHDLHGSPGRRSSLTVSLSLFWRGHL